MTRLDCKFNAQLIFDVLIFKILVTRCVNSSLSVKFSIFHFPPHCEVLFSLSLEESTSFSACYWQETIGLNIMLDSALLSEQPVSYNDKLVYKGLLEASPLFFQGLSKTSQVSHHSRAPSMIIGASFAIAFAIIITCSRLWVRIFRSRAFGADDVVIIPAAIGCVAYLALIIASERAGCLGKHVYDCTYKEMGWYYEVSGMPF